MAVFLAVENPQEVKKCKSILEKNNLYDKTCKIVKKQSKELQSLSNNNSPCFLIPTICSSTQISDWNLSENDISQLLSCASPVKFVEAPSTPKTTQKHLKSIEEATRQFLIDTGVTISLESKETLLQSLPSRYSIYPPMVLFPTNSFTGDAWDDLWNSLEILGCSKMEYFGFLVRELFAKLGCSHLAVNQPIPEQDTLRRPFALIPLFGDFGPDPSTVMFEHPTSKDFSEAFWVAAVQNGITQTWAPRYTMFSRGNIKEKARVLTFPNVENSVVVDLYGGIGYFTFSYLKAGASTVYAWELNPWSVEGMRRGAECNHWGVQVVEKEERWCSRTSEDVRLCVFRESNERAMERLAGEDLSLLKHVNLGLLPDSKQGWGTALRLIRRALECCKQGVVEVTMHVHENVGKQSLGAWMEQTKSALDVLAEELLESVNVGITADHLELIKTFAPDVWHVCGDFTVTITEVE